MTPIDASRVSDGVRLEKHDKVRPRIPARRMRRPSFPRPLENFYDEAIQEKGKMYGKEWTSQRRTLQLADKGVRTYKYSGASAADTIRFSKCPTVKLIRRYLYKDFDVWYNFCLVNFYPVVLDKQGNVDVKSTAKLGWHSDDEDDIVEESPIASISLGDLRRFRVRSKKNNSIKWDHKLEHGSLVIMEGKCQKKMQHCIWGLGKKDVEAGDASRGMRINLTFRVMKEE